MGSRGGGVCTAAGSGRPSPRVCLPAPKEMRAWLSAGGAPSPRRVSWAVCPARGTGGSFLTRRETAAASHPARGWPHCRAERGRGPRAWLSRPTPWAADTSEPPCPALRPCSLLSRRGGRMSLWAPRGREVAQPLPAASPAPGRGPAPWPRGSGSCGVNGIVPALLSFLSFFLQIDSHDSKVARHATRSESKHKVTIPRRRRPGRGSWRLPGTRPGRRAALRSGFLTVCGILPRAEQASPPL